MACRDPTHCGGYANDHDIMPNESLMDYCLLFTQSKSLLYDLYSDQWGCYINIPLLDGRRETYALNVAGGHSGADAARLAGYCREHPKNARVMSWYLLKRSDVRDRIAQLRKEASDDAIMTLIQIRQILSQIARACLKDYQDSNGKFRPLDDDTPNPSAVAEVIYKFDPIKRQPYIASLRLRDPVDAIVELCRLDGAYKKKPMTVQLAPITSVSVDQARSKISAHLETVVLEAEDTPLPEEGVDGQQMNSTILSGQHERLSSRPLLEEGKGSNNTEVTHGRQRKGTTSIFPSQIG